MASIINVSINLKKLDKNRIKHKNTGSYYDLTLFVQDEPNKFGQDVMVTERLTKEERESGEKKGNILGNGKVAWSKPKHTPDPSDFDNDSSERTGTDNLPF